mmetsp:Transcript_23398/g.67420  ORF Transcript_23398/g.67420 Transcript_23398/m.67420 type:complete len:200 (-) Transcript_23398:100-699(-)
MVVWGHILRQDHNHSTKMKQAIVLSALCLAAQAHISTAFAPIQQQRHTHVYHQVAIPKSGGAFVNHQTKGSSNVVLSMSDDEGSGNISDQSAAEVPATPPSPPAASAVAGTKTEVPLDLPSPVLLAGSMVLAIVSTGSIFELLGGSPQYGMIPTALFAVLGTPLCFFLFYSAILKGNAETEADDQRFMDNTKNSSSGFF